MRRILSVVAAVALFVLCVIAYQETVFARIGDPQPSAVRPDTWSVGQASAEVIVDFDGNLIPGVDNDVTLGSATHRWRDVRSLNMTLGNALTVNGNSVLGDASNDTLDLNITTVTINDTIHGVKIGTSTTYQTYILTITGGANRRLGIGTNAPGATLDSDGTAIFNESGADADLRIESDNNANMIIVDASADAVGIGTDSTPDATLEVSPRAADAFVMRVSSNNGSTDLLAVSQANLELQLGIPQLPFTRTKAQIQALSPRVAGLWYLCSDCTRTYTLCVTTGTGVQQLREQGTTSGPCE